MCGDALIAVGGALHGDGLLLGGDGGIGDELLADGGIGGGFVLDAAKGVEGAGVGLELELGELAGGVVEGAAEDGEGAGIEVDGGVDRGAEPGAGIGVGVGEDGDDGEIASDKVALSVFGALHIGDDEAIHDDGDGGAAGGGGVAHILEGEAGAEIGAGLLLGALECLVVRGGIGVGGSILEGLFGLHDAGGAGAGGGTGGGRGRLLDDAALLDDLGILAGLELEGIIGLDGEILDFGEVIGDGGTVAGALEAGREGSLGIAVDGEDGGEELLLIVAKDGAAGTARGDSVDHDAAGVIDEAFHEIGSGENFLDTEH